MMDKKYQQLLDQEVLAYIGRVGALAAEDTVRLPIEQQRMHYNDLCQAFHAGRPEGVTTRDAVIGSTEYDIPVRHYHTSKHNAGRQIIYYHGGGFVIGNLDSHDDICAELCDRTGFDVMAVDYRLAPENTHPAAYNDALAAYRSQAHPDKTPVILVGDSAGATLAAAVSHTTRNEAIKPAGQVLIYPALGGDPEQGSYVEHAQAPMLTAEDMLYYYQAVTGGREIRDDPTFLPLMDQDFSHLPATFIFTADFDPLRDDGYDYQQKIRQAGGQAEWVNEPGLVHGYLRARHSVKRAGDSFERIVQALNSLDE